MIRPSTPADFGVGEKLVDAVDVDRIVIAHQHQRRGVVVLAKPAHHRQRLLQGHAGLQRAQPRRLDRRTVRHRIGEGHADLDDVGAGLRQRLDDLERGRRIRIAGHQEGDEGRAALFLQFGEACVDAGGHDAASAVLYLSPRGGRLRSSRVRGMDKFKASEPRAQTSRSKLWQRCARDWRGGNFAASIDRRSIVDVIVEVSVASTSSEAVLRAGSGSGVARGCSP